MEPSALAKAASLYHYAETQGSPLDTFQLALTEAEANELLLWYGEQYGGSNEMFDLDFELAKRTHDPWPMLGSFVLMGLKMVPASALQ